MSLTCDPNDPDLGHGVDEDRVAQNKKYLVDCDDDAVFVRPLRLSYKHLACGAITTMHESIAATYAKNPAFYGATYCVRCRKHLAVGAGGEFVWDDGSGEKVGT